MRLTKIYTKIGDKGTTKLATGETVSKGHLRIEAYGTVDELNAAIGMLRDAMAPHSELADMTDRVAQIQNDLFDLGGELSMTPGCVDLSRLQIITSASVRQLEAEMDAMNETLPPLENFILPGGNPVNSTAHLARTVCRRAERCVVRLAEVDEVRSECRIYLNRLSDWLFVLCRAVSAKLGVAEVLWRQNKKTQP